MWTSAEWCAASGKVWRRCGRCCSRRRSSACACRMPCAARCEGLSSSSSCGIPERTQQEALNVDLSPRYRSASLESSISGGSSAGAFELYAKLAWVPPFRSVVAPCEEGGGPQELGSSGMSVLREGTPSAECAKIILRDSLAGRAKNIVPLPCVPHTCGCNFVLAFNLLLPMLCANWLTAFVVYSQCV